MLLRNGQAIEVLDRGSTHKWLGCMLCTAKTGSHTLDLAHHLRAASKAFYANRPYLVNRNVAMPDRFKYFNAMVTPVACFGAAHRKVYKQDLSGCCVPLLGHLVTWIGRCRGMKSLIIGTNERNSSQVAMA